MSKMETPNTPDTPEPTQPFYKKKLFLIVGISVLALVCVLIGAYIGGFSSKDKTGSESLKTLDLSKADWLSIRGALTDPAFKEEEFEALDETALQAKVNDVDMTEILATITKAFETGRTKVFRRLLDSVLSSEKVENDDRIVRCVNNLFAEKSSGFSAKQKEMLDRVIENLGCVGGDVWIEYATDNEIFPRLNKRMQEKILDLIQSTGSS